MARQSVLRSEPALQHVNRDLWYLEEAVLV